MDQMVADVLLMHHGQLLSSSPLHGLPEPGRAPGVGLSAPRSPARFRHGG
ncbi:hypothetical protein G3I50_09345 [Streptomyces parvus]|uniref:Uncharacterized protein n=1 Tax=Streptomyces parvus TaxID=66428 RepID=A0A7K3RTG0_9ACTN|nr:hypothetical protein [Streptomyces parvus]